jgi:hypothetical protein
MSAKVQGFCPMGCGATLFLGSGGYVTCSYSNCPRPDAATVILEERETEHLVTIDDNTFTVKHPLKERLDDAILTCDIAPRLHHVMTTGDLPALRTGRYRATAISRPMSAHDSGYHWAKLPGLAESSGIS